MKRLISDYDFRSLIISNFIAKVGDGVHEFVFVIIVLKITDGNLAKAGIIYFLRFIPFFLIGPVAGKLSDTQSKKKIMVFCDVARAIITLCLSIVLFFNKLDFLGLALFGMAMTSFRALYSPAYSSTIRILVADSKLQSANSQNQIAAELGLVVGPILGATANYCFGNYGMVMAIDCMTFLVSGILLTTIKNSGLGEKRWSCNTLNKFFRLYYNFYIRKKISQTSIVNTAIIYSAICILFVGGSITILLPKFIILSFSSEELVGIVMSLISVGTIMGAMACTKFNLNASAFKLMMFWALYGSVIFIAPLIEYSIYALYFWAVILGIFGALVDISIPTIIQRDSNPENIGSNFSYFSTLANSGDALSGPVVGLVAMLVGISGTLHFVGIFVVISAMLGFVALRR